MLKPVIKPIEEIFEDSKNGKILLLFMIIAGTVSFTLDFPFRTTSLIAMWITIYTVIYLYYVNAREPESDDNYVRRMIVAINGYYLLLPLVMGIGSWNSKTAWYFLVGYGVYLAIDFSFKNSSHKISLLMHDDIINDLRDPSSELTQQIRRNLNR